MNSNTEEKIIPFVFSIIILSLFIVSMWGYSVQYSNDRMSQIVVYLDASDWLSNNLLEEENIILPVPEMFWTINPVLKQKTKTYQSFWEDADVDVIHATEEERNKVKQNFWNYVSADTNKIKYVVVALNDMYNLPILDIHPKEFTTLEICNKINSKLYEATRFNFQIPSTDWKNSLVICEVK